MAATAMAVAPTDFLLRPKSAYAAVCNCSGQGCPCGSACCDGYTEFCCTLTGQNGCPPGTVAGGWWKVDGSGFCGGAPRYYVDCNAQCGGCGCRGGICDGSCSGTPCGCAHGDCNHRKAGCTRFRYGQCNQHVACLGPIVCRMVTCTPPWLVDGSCTTASRTDNRTANHTAPCLDLPFGSFDGVVDVGGGMRVHGWAIDPSRDEVHAHIYVDQKPVVSVRADRSRPDVAAAYPAFGDSHGFEALIPCEPGRHVVCVLAYDTGSGSSKFLAFTTVELSGPRGNLDLVESPAPGRLRVVGWADDRFAPGQVAQLRLIVDGQRVASFASGIGRPDVAAAHPGAFPSAGFDASFDAAPGRHLVCVEIVYRSGFSALIGCREVVVG